MLAVFEGYSPQAGLEQGGGKDPVKGCRHHLTALGEETAALVALVGGLRGQGNARGH